jgi:hypothetical protein
MEKNIMLKSVLIKLIDCMNEYNRYMLKGWSTAADSVGMKAGILRECLEAAGYKMHITTEHVEITEGTYRGSLVDCYTIVSFDIPTASGEDIKAFQEAGFEWLWASNMVKYKFVMNRKGKEAV